MISWIIDVRELKRRHYLTRPYKVLEEEGNWEHTFQALDKLGPWTHSWHSGIGRVTWGFYPTNKILAFSDSSLKWTSPPQFPSTDAHFHSWCSCRSKKERDHYIALHWHCSINTGSFPEYNSHEDTRVGLYHVILDIVWSSLITWLTLRNCFQNNDHSHWAYWLNIIQWTHNTTWQRGEN